MEKADADAFFGLLLDPSALLDVGAGLALGAVLADIFGSDKEASAKPAPDAVPDTDSTSEEPRPDSTRLPLGGSPPPHGRLPDALARFRPVRPTCARTDADGSPLRVFREAACAGIDGTCRRWDDHPTMMATLKLDSKARGSLAKLGGRPGQTYSVRTDGPRIVLEPLVSADLSDDDWKPTRTLKQLMRHAVDELPEIPRSKELVRKVKL